MRRLQYQSAEVKYRPKSETRKNQELRKFVTRYPSFSAITCKIPSHVVRKPIPWKTSHSKSKNVKKYPSYENIRHKIDDENPSSRTFTKRVRTEYIKLPSFSNVNSTISCNTTRRKARLPLDRSNESVCVAALRQNFASNSSFSGDNEKTINISSRGTKMTFSEMVDDISVQKSVTNRNEALHSYSDFKSPSSFVVCDDRSNGNGSRKKIKSSFGGEKAIKNGKSFFWLPSIQRKRIREVFRGGSKLLTLPFSLFIHQIPTK